MSNEKLHVQQKDHIPLPNAAQLRYHRDELAAFMHFGMNTYTDSEWGNGQESPDNFDPPAFHPDKMIKALKDVGFKRLIITAKHHDGFCLWHTKFTRHSVEHSPYGGDILAELSAACSAHGLDMGLYLSPWDVHEPSYGYGEGFDEATDSNGDYNEFYINQILEIASNPKYGRDGRFVEWWLDGAKGTGSQAQEYDFDSWIAAIRRHNPDILIFGAGSEGGVHWVGNERGWAPDVNWCKLPAGLNAGTNPALVEKTDGKLIWSIPEVDVSINAGWFWHEGQEPKDPRKLGDIYFDSVGRGSPLLLNVPPNKDGDFSDSYYEALRRFGENIEMSFEKNLADGLISAESFNVLSDWHYQLDLTFTEQVSFDCFEIKELIEETGQLIDNIVVQVETEQGWRTFMEGGTVGARCLLRGESVTTTKIRVQLSSIDGEPRFTTPALYQLTEDFRAQREDHVMPLNFTASSITVKAGDKAEVTVRRDQANADKTVIFYLDTPPGSAVSGQYYKDRTHERIEFSAGVADMTFEIETYAATFTVAKDFFVEISMDNGTGRTLRKQTKIVLEPK